MQSVRSRVCNNLHSGSDEYVYLRFRSKKYGEFYNIHGEKVYGKFYTKCLTEVLNGPGNNWGRGQAETWGHHQRWGGENHNYLGSCAKKFRPGSDNLEFRVEISGGLGDDLEICQLRVTFGKGQKGSSTWVWSADWPNSTQIHPVWYNRYEEGTWKKGCLTCKIPAAQISLCWWRVFWKFKIPTSKSGFGSQIFLTLHQQRGDCPTLQTFALWPSRMEILLGLGRAFSNDCWLESILLMFIKHPFLDLLPWRKS